MISNDWNIILKDIYKKEYFINIMNEIDRLYKSNIIYPERKDLFKALKLTSYKCIKVVILGQDPYHGTGEANGLSFSVNHGVNIPPSLRNIFKELYDDTGILRTNTDLSDWARQGVLLLNSVFTVEKDKPASHKYIGWEEFTDDIIKLINQKDTSVVFILWGNFAKSKIKYITNPKHLIISSSHPSPFSCRTSFFGSKPFSRTNKFLKDNNMSEIEW